ncbi:hypothetical protein V8E55_009876 [Tylopilus felleus]
MKIAILATLATIVVSHVSGSPVEDVLTPSGVPATSGPSLTSLSFASPTDASILSGISSLISSESTALYPFTATVQPTFGPSPNVSTPTTSSVPLSTSTNSARRLGLGSSDPSSMVAGVSLVLGAIAALVC